MKTSTSYSRWPTKPAFQYEADHYNALPWWQQTNKLAIVFYALFTSYFFIQGIVLEGLGSGNLQKLVLFLALPSALICFGLWRQHAGAIGFFLLLMLARLLKIFLEVVGPESASQLSLSDLLLLLAVCGLLYRAWSVASILKAKRMVVEQTAKQTQ